MPSDPTKRITVNCPPELRAELAQYAKETGRSYSDLIRDAAVRALRERKRTCAQCGRQGYWLEGAFQDGKHGWLCGECFE